jgi:hypothetical protein
VSVLDVDKKVEIVARNATGTYWIVKNLGGSGVCWLWDEYAVVTDQTESAVGWVANPPKFSLLPKIATLTSVVSREGK